MSFLLKTAKLFRKHWLLILILAIAAFFRLYNISGYMEFLGDQGRDVLIVRRFLTKADFMFIGPQTSVGNIYLSPWYYYFIAPFLLIFNFSPVGPAVAVALVGIATVWLVWYVSNSWFDEKTAYLSSLLYAVSPVVIKYSSFSWNPNVMPFFALLSVWLSWQVWQEKKFKYLVYLGFSLGAVLASHYLGLLVFPLCFGMIFLTFRKTSQASKKNLFKYLVLGILVFLAMIFPLVLFDIKHNGVNAKALVSLLAGEGGALGFSLADYIFSLLSNLSLIVTRLVGGKNNLAGSSLTFILAADSFWLSISPANLKKRPLFVILAWIVTGLLGLSFYRFGLVDHYFGFLYPALFILFGYIVSRAINQKKALKAIGLTVYLFVLYLLLSQNPLRYPANNQLANTKAISQFVTEKSAGKEFNLALLAERNYDPPYRYFLELENAPLKNLHDQIADQLFVICDDLDCVPLGNSFWDVAAFGIAKVDQKWNVAGKEIYKLVHRQ